MGLRVGVVAASAAVSPAQEPHGAIARDPARRRREPRPGAEEERRRSRAPRALASCRNQNDLLQLSLRASAVIDDTEEGSILNNRKTKSFHQRWYEKSEGHAAGELKSDDSEEEDGLYIERDALIESKVKWGDKKKCKLVKRMFRVQSVLQKYHGKWFMTGERKKWSRSMTEDKKKQYIRMQMVE